ncbi:MAG: hypothetical protein M3Z41_00525 [Candidatus Eremiobacteraeota bacterium]|nr:hypothetical protein [Candidatus Eremiobacteraeota bacterium]
MRPSGKSDKASTQGPSLIVWYPIFDQELAAAQNDRIAALQGSTRSTVLIASTKGLGGRDSSPEFRQGPDRD